MSRLLTREEEYVLGTAIQKGLKSKEVLETEGEKLSFTDKTKLQKDIREYEKSFQILFERNMDLVQSCARKQMNRFPTSFDYEDYVQEGTIGLMTAILKFDPERGNKFSTVAFPWINQAINRSINKTSKMIRLPENRIYDSAHMTNIIRENEDSMSTKEINKLIKETLGLTDRQIQDIRNASNGHTSLNKKINEEDSSEEISSFSAFGFSESSEEEFLNELDVTALMEEISKLHPLRADVICSYYGIMNNSREIPTPRDVRGKYKISHSIYKRICNETISSLRNSFSQRKLVK